MNLEELVKELRGSIGDPVSGLDDDVFVQALENSTRVYSAHRGLSKSSEISLIAGVGEYSAPVDAIKIALSQWGSSPVYQRYDPMFPGAVPYVVIEGGQVKFLPAPTASIINVYGATYSFSYYSNHILHETENDQTTIPEMDKDLILMWGKVEVFVALAAKMVNTPIQMHGGHGKGGANGTPGQMAESLQKVYFTLIEAR